MSDDIDVFTFDDKNDRLQLDNLKCPCCGVKHMMHVPYVHASCKKCGQKYKTDLKQDIYTKKAKELNSWKAHKNEFKMMATEDYEQDLIHFKVHHEKMKCWDVSEITEETKTHKRCNDCGICLNCFTCKGCGKTFEKDPNRRKLKCPHCQSDNFVQTFFKKVNTPGDNKHIRLCPHCNSDRVVMSRVTNKSNCDNCKSKNLSEPIKERVFWLDISRKRGYFD